MRWLIDFFGADKLAHFGVSFAAAFLLAGLGWQLAGHAHAATFGFVGFLGSFYGGLAKEWGDYQNPANRWDWGDVLADAIGAFVGALLIVLCSLAKG